MHDRFLQALGAYRASAIALVLANAVPLIGVILFKWDAFQIVAVYWAESVVIGLISILKVIACNPDPSAIDRSSLNWFERRAWSAVGTETKSAAKYQLSKLVYIPWVFMWFVCILILQGFFVAYAFGVGEDAGPGSIRFSDQEIRALHLGELMWAAVALTASHLYSFFRNYIGRGEYRRTVFSLLLLQPLGRILLLSAAILVGLVLSSSFGANTAILLALIVGKTLVDLGLHLRERRRMAKSLSAEQLHSMVRD
jgi:hypothetical protein